MLKSYKCIYFLLNVNFIVFIHWMLILYMYSPIYSSLYCTQVHRTDLYFVYQQNLLPKGMLCNAVACPHLVRSGMGTA